jgi:hypothetical protein
MRLIIYQLDGYRWLEHVESIEDVNEYLFIKVNGKTMRWDKTNILKIEIIYP